jgi:hypothetical protein
LFCPNCKLEYRAGFTRCSDCDVDLIDALPKAADGQEVGVHDLRTPVVLRRGVSVPDAAVIRDALNASGIRFNTRQASAEIVADGTPSYEFWVNAEDRPNAQAVLETALEAADNGEPLDSPQLLWGGSDRGFFDQLCASLDDEKIPYLRNEPFESRLAEVAPRNPLEISVGKSNYDPALKILASLSDDSTSAKTTNNGADGDDNGDYDDDDDDSDSKDDLAGEDDELGDLDDDELTAEAWSGRTGDLAGMLKMCLREVGILSRASKNGSNERLLVAEQDLARSKEIIREVIEATPPE